MVSAKLKQVLGILRVSGSNDICSCVGSGIDWFPIVKEGMYFVSSMSIQNIIELPPYAWLVRVEVEAESCSRISL